MQCPDCEHSYIPGQVICEECGSDLSPIEVPTVLVSKSYCEPNQLVEGIKGCGDPITPPISKKRLVIEGNQTILYEGRSVSEIAFDVDELSIGCRDTEQEYYPDIDLLKYRGHDPFISRKHAILFKENDKYFIQIISQAESTGFNNKSDIIAAGERREIQTGDRIFFSDSIVIKLKDG